MAKKKKSFSIKDTRDPSLSRATAQSKNLEPKVSFVIFIDVLGFKELVTSKSKTSRDKIKFYFRMVRAIKTIFGQTYHSRNLRIVCVSDSLIITHPVGRKSKLLDNLTSLLLLTSKFQQMLALHNIWIRGGVSVGEIYVDVEANIVFGTGLVNAYIIESQHAHYPRVVLDNKLIKHFGYDSVKDLITAVNTCPAKLSRTTNLLFDWFDFHPLKSYLQRDTSTFIDYLSDLEDLRQWDTLSSYITRNLSACGYGVYSKHIWTMNYILATLERKIQHEKENKRASQMKKIFLSSYDV